MQVCSWVNDHKVGTLVGTPVTAVQRKTWSPASTQKSPCCHPFPYCLTDISTTPTVVPAFPSKAITCQ
jgi:hypothetical protein